MQDKLDNLGVLLNKYYDKRRVKIDQISKTTSGYKNTFRLYLYTLDKGDRFLAVFQGTAILTGRYDYKNYNGYVKVGMSVYLEFYKRNSYISNANKVPFIVLEDTRETKNIWAYRISFDRETNKFLIDFSMNGDAAKTQCGIIVDTFYNYGFTNGGVEIDAVKSDDVDGRFTIF